MVTLTLPKIPPSVNNLFINVGKRRIVSQRYDEWRQLAGWELQRQRPEKVTGPVRLSYEFGEPDRRKRDLGNLEKAATDLLVAHGVIEADDNSVVREIRLTWAPVEGVRITIEPIA